MGSEDPEKGGLNVYEENGESNEDPKNGIQMRAISAYRPPARISSSYMTNYTGNNFYQVLGKVMKRVIDYILF